MYATWAFIMFLETLSITLHYEFDIDSDKIHIIIICTLLSKILLYFFIENIVMYDYCKFMITPWIMYGLFLIDLLNSLGENNGVGPGYRLIPSRGSYWDFQVSNLASMLNLNYFLEICITAIFIFLFICKVIKFVWSEFCNRKTFLNSF